MIVLDENIDERVRSQLLEWRIRFRQIGKEIARKGTSDSGIIEFLHGTDHSTFFTRDRDFNRPALCHPRYGIVFLDMARALIATYMRRVLAHPDFDTQAKRSGAVLEVSKNEIKVWRLPQRQMQKVAWVEH